jgi:glycerophosphoryl diester phosphodiesterase
VGGHPENTLGSFLAGVEAGLRWVEIDARLSADGVLVAHHDPMVGGRFVAEQTAAETGLMRVQELFDALPADVGVDVDVKTALEDAVRPPESATAARVAELLAPERDRRPLLVTSFDPAALLALRERLPGVPVGLLTWLWFPLRKAIAAAAGLGLDVVAPHVGSFALQPRANDHDPAQAIAVAHQAGLQVLAWCPADEAEARALVAAGVDGLVVDDVPAAVRWDYTSSIVTASSLTPRNSA